MDLDVCSSIKSLNITQNQQESNKEALSKLSFTPEANKGDKTTSITEDIISPDPKIIRH